MLLSQIILILDSQGKESSCYQEMFKEDLNIYPVFSEKLSDAYELMEKFEPDLILVCDNFDQNIAEICSAIRQKSSSYRPVVIAISDLNDPEEKMEALRAGADDFINSKIASEELSLRIFAHLRRHVEELASHSLRLPGASMTYKITKRNVELDKDDPLAIMYIDIDNFNPYKDGYGNIASEKLIQTFVAIIKTSISDQDFLGQIGEDKFIILTRPEKAERIAMFLSYSFDMVSPKFYSSEDIDRGYLILSGDEKVGRRIPLVSISVGISTNKYSKFLSFQDAIGKSRNLHRLAKSRAGSFWVSDKPQLANQSFGEGTNQKILVVESDAALAYLLHTTLEMEGYEVDITASVSEAAELIERNVPSLTVIDIPDETSTKELELCSKIKEKYPDIKVIVSTVDRDKEKVFNTGADLYIPKPYELMVLFNWVSKFLNYEVCY